MNVVVFSIDEESLSDSGITIFISLQVELDLVWEEWALVRSDDFALVCEDGALVPVLLTLELLKQLSSIDR